jgi:hypothetical protein
MPPDIFGEILPNLIEALPASGEDSGFALPSGTLACLEQLVREARIRKVFEFGSGRSTKTFLEAGCEVTTVEDSQHWLDETLQTIAPEDRSRLQVAVLPLRTVWHRGVPMRGWHLTRELLDALNHAELVLIDSPSSPPFREFPLILSLTHADSATIMIDDANIPTVQRFCRRLAKNQALVSKFTPKDHGLYFFGRKADTKKIDFSRGLVESMKGWRRFFVAGQLASHSTT